MRNGEDNAEVDYERVCGLGRGSTAGANEGELVRREPDSA